MYAVVLGLGWKLLRYRQDHSFDLQHIFFSVFGGAGKSFSSKKVQSIQYDTQVA